MLVQALSERVDWAKAAKKTKNVAATAVGEVAENPEAAAANVRNVRIIRYDVYCHARDRGTEVDSGVPAAGNPGNDVDHTHAGHQGLEQLKNLKRGREVTAACSLRLALQQAAFNLRLALQQVFLRSRLARTSMDGRDEQSQVGSMAKLAVTRLHHHSRTGPLTACGGHPGDSLRSSPPGAEAPMQPRAASALLAQRHLAHFSWMPEEDLTIFEALREQLTFVPGDTHDARFKLQVCRPSRRSCRTAMDAVAGTKSPALQRVVEELCQIFQMELHRCWVNLYRAGTDDHAAFHRDHFDGRSGGAQVTLGVFASFGDRRDLCWSFGGRATAWRLPLRNGDVVAFDRTANAAGLHSIEKKLDAAEDRISVSLWGTGRIPGHAPCPPFAPPARRWRAKEAPPPRRWTRRETVEEKRNMGGGGGGGRWE
ncbi:unnamed protein product [Durusdinium trenchii]|uniref:Fe2OG dioxygenase domain-containing protein n=1 Tax=Durusdinium trenchii TaxID=1381693 RepID=A0ABP0HHC9_9DINO